MVGAKLQTLDRVGQATSAGGSRRLRCIAVLSALLPLSLVLVQCGRAPSAGALAANVQTSSNVQASSGDNFDDRFPAPQFRDRFPTASESLEQRQPAGGPSKRTAQAQPAPYRVASL